MKGSSIRRVLPISFVLFFVLVATSSSANIQTFLQCLNTHSLPSQPIFSSIYTPNNSSYSSVLQSYIRNLRFNTSTTPKPILILTASHVSHIQAAVICGQEHDLVMKIRSGGHDYEGVSYVYDKPFFVLDLFNLRSINVSIEDETAWVQTGAIIGELYYKISEKSDVHGFPAGVCPTVAVGGHFSGGGYGNMMRKHGLSVDNILDALIIDVKGRVLDRKSMGEDLFWAITGGGASSFGVVLSYKIKLVRVPKNVTVFQVERTLEQNATDIVYRWQHVAPNVHEDIFLRTNIEVVPSTTHKGKTIRATFITLFLGDTERLLSIMNQDFPELGLQRSDCKEMSWIESTVYYTGFPANTPTTVLLDRTPRELTYNKKQSDYLKNPISKKGWDYIFKKLLQLDNPMLTLNPYGGRMAEISEFAKPFPHRAGNIAKIFYGTNWYDNGVESTKRYLAIARKLYSYMTPFVSKNPREAFLNYRDLDIGINHNGDDSYYEGAVYGIKYFKNNFERLVKIKTKVDPHNYFRNEQSIPVDKSLLIKGISSGQVAST